MDLIKLITDKLQEIESSGKLLEIIEKHVIECVDDIVKDSFKWSGEVKKAIKEALGDKLGVSLEDVNIQQYNKAVAAIVSERVDGTSMEWLKNNITEAVDSVIGVIEKKKWKLSEIMEKFIEGIDKSYDEMEGQCGECSLVVVREPEAWVSVYFDKEKNQKRYMCSNTIYISKGRLVSVYLHNKPFSPFEMSQKNAFEKFMFTIYCNNVEIEIDEDDCELEYYREDYD